MSFCQVESELAPAAKVMIVEDEPIVALDIQYVLEDAGFVCLGPYHSVAAALDNLDRSAIEPEFALLDVNLRDGQVFPVADALYKRGTPFAFCSAHFVNRESENRYPGVSVIGKPFSAAQLIEAVIAGLRN